MPHDDSLMTDEQREVWRFLCFHYAGAACVRERATILGHYNTYHIEKLSDRVFRQICSDLVVHFGKAICTTAAGGYFVARTADELGHAIKDLESRGVAILDRARALKQALPLEPQGRLF